MKTNMGRRSALWAAVLAGAFWGLVGAGSVPAYAQKSPAVASAASPSDQDISIVDAQRGAFDRFLDAHPEIASDVVDRPAVMSDPNYLHGTSRAARFSGEPSAGESRPARLPQSESLEA